MPLLYHNNNSISNVTSFPQVPSGSPVLLSTATASASSSISFTSGIDSTYDVYYFEFINIHPASDQVDLVTLYSTDGGSSYGITKTTTAFQAYHAEGDFAQALSYNTGLDLAQSTSASRVTSDIGNENDEDGNGFLYLFNPSSTTYVKHFMSRASINNGAYAQDEFFAGYLNTTLAINAVKFQMISGNLDSGTIKMYGIK